MNPHAPDSSGLKPAVFFDRDGVVNVSPGPGYVLDWDGFQFSPGIFEVLRLCRDRGYERFVVTSQKGVGKRLMTQADLDEIHHRMQARLEEEGAPFREIFSHTGTADTPYPPKPDPAMMLAAARDHGIDLSASWVIGDADRDIAMGQAAGLKGTIRVRSDQPIGVEADYTVDSVAALIPLLKEVL